MFLRSIVNSCSVSSNSFVLCESAVVVGCRCCDCCCWGDMMGVCLHQCVCLHQINITAPPPPQPQPHSTTTHTTTTTHSTTTTTTEYTQNTLDKPWIACTSHLPHSQTLTTALCAYSPRPSHRRPGVFAATSARPRVGGCLPPFTLSGQTQTQQTARGFLIACSCWASFITINLPSLLPSFLPSINTRRTHPSSSLPLPAICYLLFFCYS